MRGGEVIGLMLPCCSVSRCNKKRKYRFANVVYCRVIRKSLQGFLEGKRSFCKRAVLKDGGVSKSVEERRESLHKAKAWCWDVLRK